MKIINIILLILVPTFAVASENKTELKLDKVNSVTPGEPNTYPKNMILTSFGDSLYIELSVAYAHEKLTMYAFATNKTQKSIKTIIKANVFDDAGVVIGKGGGHEINIAPNTSQLMIGINIFKEGGGMTPLMKSDIVSPITITIMEEEH